ncbi:MAG: oligopeptide/dipeptide ABC transporter ATP-binding protein [Paracoccaceae bacterium]
MTTAPILSVRDVEMEYTVKGKTFAAVSGINLDLSEGETLGLVGESGCGKSTIGRSILQLPSPTRGSVTFKGTELNELSHTEMRPIRSQLQIIFQDPVSSLNPRRKVKDIVAGPLTIAKIGTREERYDKVEKMLHAVGVDPSHAMERRPHQFSGGQCQRISIARALIIEPKVIVCDEAVSALDVSVQAQIVNLLEDMKERFGLTLLFISHDLAVVKHISDRVAVMYLGNLCELAPSDRIYGAPAHPYTLGLIGTIPTVEGGRATQEGRVVLSGELPSPLNPPSGCRFRTRCPYAQEKCANEAPQLRFIDDEHYMACHFPLIETP